MIISLDDHRPVFRDDAPLAVRALDHRDALGVSHAAILSKQAATLAAQDVAKCATITFVALSTWDATDSVVQLFTNLVRNFRWTRLLWTLPTLTFYVLLVGSNVYYVCDGDVGFF